MFSVDREPILHPPQDVSIEQIKKELEDNLHCKSSTNLIKEKPKFESSYSVLPTHNTVEHETLILNSYRFSVNKYLNCKWDHFITSLPRRILPLKYPNLKDVQFHCSQVINKWDKTNETHISNDKPSLPLVPVLLEGKGNKNAQGVQRKSSIKAILKNQVNAQRNSKKKVKPENCCKKNAKKNVK